MTPEEYAASEARRLLDELKPYFTKLESRIVEDMLAIHSEDEDSDRKRRCLADKVTAIRDIRGLIGSVILQGSPKRVVGIA